MPQMAPGKGLFDELKIRDVRFLNRIAVSPMCQYSCQNGLATDWHFVHLGSRAVGGAALVMAEARRASVLRIWGFGAKLISSRSPALRNSSMPRAV